MSAGAPFAAAAVAILLLGPGAAFAQSSATGDTGAPSEPCRVERPATGAVGSPDQGSDGAAPQDHAGSPVANPSAGTLGGPAPDAVGGTLDDTVSSSAWQSTDGSTAAAGADGDCALILPR